LSPPIHPKPCENLPQDFYLYRGTEEAIGFIYSQPEHEEPQSLATLTLTSHSKGEMRLLQPQGDGFCSYKLRTMDSEPLRFPAEEMISSKFSGMENYFGIPGTLTGQGAAEEEFLPPMSVL